MPYNNDHLPIGGHSCPHNDPTNKAGLAVIAIGNSLRTDDGAGQALLKTAGETVAGDCCSFVLGTKVQFLPDCLTGHRAGIIIDAMYSGLQPGASTVIDLHSVLKNEKETTIDSCHGLSLIDELKLASLKNDLPEKLLLFGIEAESDDWGQGISRAVKDMLPELASKLAKITQDLANEVSSHA